jgi:hypothetical protein
MPVWMSPLRRWLIAGPLALSGLLLAPASLAQSAPIEARYAAPGPKQVSRSTVLDTQGRPQYELFLPQPLGRGHPIIVWGNGTGTQPKDYQGLLSHLASWGFAVVDNYQRNTGAGSGILQAAQALVAAHDDPASPLFGRLDPSRVGASGHSQGATGVINAATRFDGSTLISTVVPVALPDRSSSVTGNYDTSLLTVPLFIIGGTEDVLISPLRVNVRAYDATDDSLPAAMAMARGAGHSEITPNGGRQRGYLTAWMMYQLRGDPLAAQAFEGPEAELLTNPNWRNARTQNLP